MALFLRKLEESLRVKALELEVVGDGGKEEGNEIPVTWTQQGLLLNAEKKNRVLGWEEAGVDFGEGMDSKADLQVL